MYIKVTPEELGTITIALRHELEEHCRFDEDVDFVHALKTRLEAQLEAATKAG